MGHHRRVEPDIPTVTTERLLLRPFRESDVEPFCALMQDPEVVRFIGDHQVPTLEDCWRAIAASIGHWVLRGYGHWAAEIRGTGELIGSIGVHNPAEWPGPEVAYTLGRRYWGHGYATEGARAAIDWAFRSTALDTLISLIDPANTASIAVALRIGETFRGETTLHGHHALVYGIDRGTWEDAAG
jgi:RimJ/RimL family protein N-acetyltransferase